jgi:hypothetical protein
MKHLIHSFAVGACLLLSSAGVTLAAGQPGTNAGVNCGTSTGPNTPGGAASAPGSPFNSTSPGTAGGVYANAFNGSGSQATTNPAATSQYDIACAHVPGAAPSSKQMP